MIRPSERRVFALVVILLAGVFAVIGGLFVGDPAAGMAVYGLSAPDPVARLYVRAIGCRDLALAAYLLGLALFACPRSLRIVFVGTLIIPAGDLAILASVAPVRPLHLALHGGSLVCFAGLAWWSRRL